MSWQARLPPSVNNLLQRLGLDVAECARADGRFTIDIKYCGLIDLVPVTGQWVVFDAALGQVETDNEARRRQLGRVLNYAASRILEHPEVVTLSEDGESFRLQLHLDTAMSPVETEETVEAYLNAIEQWRMHIFGSVH